MTAQKVDDGESDEGVVAVAPEKASRQRPELARVVSSSFNSREVLAEACRAHTRQPLVFVWAVHPKFLIWPIFHPPHNPINVIPEAVDALLDTSEVG